MKIRTQAPSQRAEPRVWPRLLKLFAAYSRQYVRRHFHAIRILKSNQPPRDISQPLVVYLNHASWWDPLVCLRLAQDFFSARTSFAPIDSKSLRRYGFFKYLGFYGVEQTGVSGALRFLRTTCSLLGCEHHAVWLTPQGHFADVRERPLRLKAGIGSLATQMPDVAFLPLAIEYTFWTEPRPEILVAFGQPVVPQESSVRNSADWTKFFGSILEAEQDDLAAASQRRNPKDWIILERGASGFSGIYGAWCWLRSLILGRPFVHGHSTEELR
jgi:1-acyl-sn-glycerol-3-phosphate acyltransferase